MQTADRVLLIQGGCRYQPKPNQAKLGGASGVGPSDACVWRQAPAHCAAVLLQGVKWLQESEQHFDANFRPRVRDRSLRPGLCTSAPEQQSK